MLPNVVTELLLYVIDSELSEGVLAAKVNMGTLMRPDNEANDGLPRVRTMSRVST